MTLDPRGGRGAVYLLDKQPGSTSRKAAAQVAGFWGYRRFGHAGTLDPSASGVLPVLLGCATRLSAYLSGHEKRYSFEVVAGIETDSLDSEGEVVRRADPVTPSHGDLARILERFEGGFDQKVPAFSAVKIGGRASFRIARAGGSPETPSRRVTAHSWEIQWIRDGRFRLAVTVSPGTYIRALASDIGAVLGCGAHATCIVRETYGAFTRAECATGPDSPAALLAPALAMRGYPVRVLTEEEASRVSHGNPVDDATEGTVALLDGPGGELLAIGTGDGRFIRPVAVLMP
jgi:tRNA pseudouridine55 synthase